MKIKETYWSRNYLASPDHRWIVTVKLYATDEEIMKLRKLENDEIQKMVLGGN